MERHILATAGVETKGSHGHHNNELPKSGVEAELLAWETEGKTQTKSKGGNNIPAHSSELQMGEREGWGLAGVSMV